MTEQTLVRGRDAGACSDAPNHVYNGKTIGLSDTRQIFLQFSGLADKVRGRTVISATLSPRPSKDITSSASVTIKPVTSKWTAGTLTWAKRPTVGAAAVTGSTGTVTAGDRWSIEIGALIQAIADGGTDFGFRLTSTSTTSHPHYAFETLDAWVLDIVLSDTPAAPTSLAPDAGAVGSGAPILGWDWTDTGVDDDGSGTEQTAVQVQIDPAADDVTPDWDSGELANLVPRLALTDTTYPGLSANATTQWRVRVKDTGGVWSEWSDWAQFTYRPKPTLTITSPAGSHLYDPTTVIEAAIDTGDIKAYRVAIFDGDDKTARRYASGRQPGDGLTFSHELPLKNHDGVRIFRDDVAYWLRAVVEDRTDRVATGDPDDPPYVEVWKQVTFDDDALPPVTAVHVEQVGDTPSVKVHWSRTGGAADAWIVIRNGEIIARLDPTDDMGEMGPVVVDPAGGWYWIDQLGLPYRSATYQIKPVVNGKQGPVGTRSDTTTVKPKGLWLIRANALGTGHGDAVVLDGTGVNGFRTNDRRATYKPPAVAYDVDIITAFEGITGTFAGTYSALRHTINQTPGQAYARMKAIKAHPEEEVILVYGDVAVPVLLRNVTVLPSETFDDNSRRKDVTFEFFQSSEFEVHL